MIRVPGPTPGPLPAAAPAGLAAMLVQVPENLRALAIGALLAGTVQGRDADGTTWLKTGSGLVGLRTTVPLPAGVTVTLQIQSAGAQLQATILPMPTQQAPPTGAQGSGAPAAAAATPPNPAAPPPPAAPIPPAVERPTAPSTVTATIIGPPGGQQAAPPQSPAAPLPPPAASPQPALPQQAPSSSPAPAPVVTQAAPSPGAPAPPPAPTAGAPVPNPNPPPNPSAPATPPGPAQALPGAASVAAYQKQMLSVPTAPSQSPSPAPPAPSTPAPAPAQTPTGSTAPPAAPPSNPAPTPLPSGTQVQLRLVPDAPPPLMPAPQSTAPSSAPTPPGAPAQPGAPAPAPTLAARVVGHTPSGQTILDAPVGRLLVKLPEPDSFRPGQIVQIQLAVAAEPPLPADIASKPLAGALALARAWPALGEAVRLLRNAADPAMCAAPERLLPQPGPTFSRRILAFIREAASGGVQEWLGETVRRAIDTLSGGGLAARIDSDLHELFAARRAGEQNWQMTIVPFLDGADLRQIRFFERRRKDKPDRRRGDDPARFVVECEHGEYGALQLDGLMQDKRLDLVLRSHAPLPDTLERDVLVIFGEACGALGLNGQLFFQAMAEFPVHPLDEFGDGGVRVSV